MKRAQHTPISDGTQQIRDKKKPSDDPHKGITVAEFYEAEDGEAMNIEWNKVEQTFLEQSARLRQLSQQLCSDNTDESEASLNESLMSYLISMRRLNRLVQFKNHKLCDSANDERIMVDERYLQLQNVQSEIGHLQKEISRCVEFRSADEDIDLVPLEEFYKNASSELKEKAHQSTHQERIARLEWELNERKTLIGTLQEREGRKNVLISDISTKENRLKSLKSMIESLIEASRPVQELMGLSTLSSDACEQRQFLAHLPKELFVIFTQVKAYADIANDKGVVIRCEGDIENAIKFNENEQRSEITNEDDYESTDVDTERDQSPCRSRRRRATANEQLTRKRDAILITHPIHLVFSITILDDVTISLRLNYLQQLRSIGVVAKLHHSSSFSSFGNILNDETVLMELYRGDTGEKCPNAVSQVKLDQFHIKVNEYERKIGRMYEFAQRMAGLCDEASTSSDDVQLCDVIRSVITKIRNRIRSRLALIKSIRSLRSLKLFDEMTSEQRSNYPMKISSQLVEFKMITADEFFSNALVTDDYREMIQSERNGNMENHFYFYTIVERESAKLMALITMNVGYPQNDTPLFILSMNVNEKQYNSKSHLLLKNLEHAVNVSLVKQIDKSHMDSLFITQMAFLVSRFDIVLEVNSELSKSSHFPREHLFTRLTKGRDQQPPLNFDKICNAFTFPLLL